MAGPDSRPPVPAAIRLVYSLPAAPLAALGLPLYAFVPTYYTETIGLPLAAVGFTLLIVRLFDAISDPVVGVLADRFRPRMGRRKLWFALSLPFAALAAFMLYSPPDDATTLWLGSWGAMLSLGFTLAVVPYSAWGAELIADYRGRTSLAAMREALTLVGTLIAIVLPFAVGARSDTSLPGLGLLGTFVAISLPLAGALAIWKVPEPRLPPETRLAFGKGLRLIAANKPFRRLVSAFFLNGFANGIPATLFLYFVSDRLGLAEARGPLLFVYFLSGIVGIPLATWAAGRVGKHRAWCWAMLAACGAFAFAPMLEVGSIKAFGAICVFTGLMLGFDLALPPAIQADVIDADTDMSGEARGGIYFAAWGLATKASLAAGVGLVFPILAAFGFEASGGTQNTQTALTALAVTYAWIPIALKLCAIGLMWNFPLDEEAQKALQLRIQALTIPPGAASPDGDDPRAGAPASRSPD
jgi:GPH family glycoside/pentoside/hexuronide:cation symporter